MNNAILITISRRDLVKLLAGVSFVLFLVGACTKTDGGEKLSMQAKKLLDNLDKPGAYASLLQIYGEKRKSELDKLVLIKLEKKIRSSAPKMHTPNIMQLGLLADYTKHYSKVQAYFRVFVEIGTDSLPYMLSIPNSKELTVKLDPYGFKYKINDFITESVKQLGEKDKNIKVNRILKKLKQFREDSWIDERKKFWRWRISSLDYCERFKQIFKNDDVWYETPDSLRMKSKESTLKKEYRKWAEAFAAEGKLPRPLKSSVIL